MTRLLALFAGNPLIFIGAVLAVFAFGVATGGSAAWYAQGLRLTHAEQEFTGYKQEQTRINQEAKDNADHERAQASKKYDAARAELAGAVESGEIYRRCVAAGKCGARTVRVPVSPTCAGGFRLPTAVRSDEAGTDAVPTVASPAEEIPVINDCAVTTLMINQLQEAIEAQAGYVK